MNRKCMDKKNKYKYYKYKKMMRAEKKLFVYFFFFLEDRGLRIEERKMKKIV